MSEEAGANTHITKLPAGKVTFLFTDIEGSTQLLDQLRDQYAVLLATEKASSERRPSPPASGTRRPVISC